MSPQVKHFPVMHEEIPKYVVKKPSGFYIDCTFGGGGHSKEILSNLDKDGRLLACDVDDNAILLGKELERKDPRFKIIKLNFESIVNYIKENNYPLIDGIIFDPGLSTFQIKDKDRGFSYFDENSFLDMRMDKNTKITASDILNNYKRKELTKIFKKYGDIRDPSRLVNNIHEYRNIKGSIETVGDIKSIIQNSCENHVNISKFTRQCFQALRIETNNELYSLEKALDSLQSIMNKDGVVAVITFHSLEENVVKNWKRKFCDVIQIQDYISNMMNKFSLLSDNFIVPTSAELSENWASRSAKLWIAVRNAN